MEPMEEEEASGLANRIIRKINELIEWVGDGHRADIVWKQEAEIRFQRLEREVQELKADNRGLRISKGKAAAAKKRAEAKLEEARRLLH